jgi:arylsulfatase A-like enzyme
MSHASLFTSRYPSELGRVAGTFHLGGNAPVLAQVLHLYGWKNLAFTSGGHLNRDFGLDRGFDWFAWTAFQGSFWHTVPATFARLDEAADAGDRFLFVHGYDAHAPYMAVAPFGRAWADPDYPRQSPGDHAASARLGTELIYDAVLFRAPTMQGWLVRRLTARHWDEAARADVRAEAGRMRASAPGQVESFGEADAAYVRATYAGAVAYEDAMFGELVAGLRQRGLWDQAIVVVLADHGEALGEEGRYGHGESLTPAELHVPLLIRVPGAAPRVVDAPVSLLDVVPTLTELLDVVPPAEAFGHSLAPWLRGEAGPSHAWRFAEGNHRQSTAVTATGQLTFDGLAPGSRFYVEGLRTAALDGPAFRGTGDAADPAGRARYRDAMLAWRAELDVRVNAEAASPEAVEAMKKEGYFSR